MIGIHLDGRPISDDAADKYLDAILEAWNPSEKGAQAIVDVLLGIVNPSGRLPVTVAFHAGQLPIFYNHDNGSSWHQGESIGFADYVDLSHHPRYYFGHGLSYTDFSYRDLEIAESSMEKQENAAQYKTEQDIAGENRNVVLKKKEGNPSKTMTGTTNRESKDVEQNAQKESFNGKRQRRKKTESTDQLPDKKYREQGRYGGSAAVCIRQLCVHDSPGAGAGRLCESKLSTRRGEKSNL